MMNKTLKYILPILLLLLILGAVVFLINSGEDLDNNSNDTHQAFTQISEDKKLEVNMAGLLTNDNSDIENAVSATSEGNLQDAITQLESLINSGEFSDGELQALQSLLASNYLSYGSAYYEESGNATKARALLENSGVSHGSWFYNYYMGYSYEIESHFAQALDYYSVALNFGDAFRQAQTLNQMGHTHDLKGDFETAFSYYKQAYDKNPNDVQVNLNLGRAYTRKGELDTAKSHFEDIVEKIDNKILKSEIYFNLSTIAFYLEKDLNVSIELAQKSVEINPDYPLGYVGIARGLLEKGEASLDAKESLDKAISLYDKLSSAHKNLGVYYYINDDFDNAIASFGKAVEASQTDITLMDDQRGTKSNEAKYFQARSYALKSEAENSMEILNELINIGDTEFITRFLGDLSVENGPFRKIEDDVAVLDTVKTALQIYNK